MTRSELVRSAALSVASLVALLALLEASVRLLVPERRWRFLDATADWQLDPELGWVNRPNLDVESAVMGRSIRFRTNPDGLSPASSRREKDPGSLRVMVFGDSMVVGRALPQEETYTSRLEELLRKHGLHAEVLNAGVQGYSTDQVLLLMERWLPVYHPNVVLYGSTLNDFGGIALDRANAQSKPRFELDVDGRLRLHPPRVAAAIESYGGGFRTWIQHSALYRFLQPGIARLRVHLFGFNERILLGVYEEAYFQPHFADRFEWRLFSALLDGMQDRAKLANARFLYFAHPEVGEVWEPYIERICESFRIPRSRYDEHAMEQRLAKAAADRGVEFLPLIDGFRAVPERGPFHLPGDGHLGPAGHERLAELIAKRLSGEIAPAASDPVGLAPHPALR